MMLKNQKLNRLFLLLLTLFVGGCSIYIHVSKDKQLDQQKNKNSILVVGYFDDSDVKFNLGWAHIKQIRPAIDEPYLEMRSDKNGLFYLENLPLGSYKLMSVDGREKGPLSTQPWTMSFPEPSSNKEYRRLELRARKSGVYFLGSYKRKLVKKGGFFGTDKFETIVLKKPTEKQVLTRLLKQAKGTKWKKIIQRRIKRLRR